MTFKLEPHTLSALGRAVARSKRTSSVALPISYIRSATTETTASRLLRSHELRLKLHLTLVMQATSAPRTLPDRPSLTLAHYLNLPEATGVRRAHEAKKWLIQNNLIRRIEQTKAAPAQLLLLNPDGSGADWPPRGDRYLTVPIGLWANGWTVALSGRAIAAFLALTELNGGSKSPSGEIMDGYRKQEYGLSADTWTRARKELELHGLLRTKTEIWGDDDTQVRRRYRYKPLPETLSSTPDWGLAPEFVSN